MSEVLIATRRLKYFDDIDMRSLESSLSDIEVDCDLPTQAETNDNLKSRTSSPLFHFKPVEKGPLLNGLFLNQGTGYSFEDICSLKTVQKPDCETNEVSRKRVSCESSKKVEDENLQYGLARKIHSNVRKRNKIKTSKRRVKLGAVDVEHKQNYETKFCYVDAHYLKDVDSSLATLNPAEALYVREIIVKQDEDGDRLIFIAIILNKLDLCNALLQFIPDECFLKTAQNKLYQTALHLSVLVGCPKLTRRFLVAGVQVDRRDYKGDTALHIACKTGNLTIARELLRPVTYLEAKQNPYDVSYQKVPQNLEIRNNEGLTCLHVAAYNKNKDIFEVLLSKFADINAVDLKNGKTCLHFFTEAGDAVFVNYLLKKPKVNVNARTYAGFTALEIANSRNQSYVAYLLLCAGAKPKIRRVDSDDFRADSESD